MGESAVQDSRAGKHGLMPYGVPGLGWRALFLVLIGAAGLAVGFPGPFWHLPPLVLLFPLSLTLLGRGPADFCPRRAKAFQLGWLSGFLGFSAVLYWVAVPVHDFGMMPWLLAVPCPLLLGAVLGLFPGAFALLACETRGCSAGTQALLLGLGWYLLEWLRSVIFTGFPWLPLAAAFAPWPELIQGAAVFGAFGLSGILAGLAAFAARGRKQACKAVGLLCLLALGGWLWIREPLETSGPAETAVLVQGNVNQNVKWEPSMQQAAAERYMALSRTALEKIADVPGGRLVIWPETAMPFNMEKDGRFTPQLMAFAAKWRTTLIAGAVGMNSEVRRYINRAYQITAEGRGGGWYEKEHLVPFGEYIPPFLDLPWLRFFMQGTGQFAPGTRTAPLPADPQENALVPGMLICYEGIFPALARERVRSGASVLVNISNDAWFGRTAAPVQHLYTALLRSVELARPMARATNTGISAFVDAHGRIAAHTRLFAAQTLTSRLAPVTVKTPFYVLSPCLPALAAAFFVLVWRCALRRRLP